MGRLENIINGVQIGSTVALACISGYYISKYEEEKHKHDITKQKLESETNHYTSSATGFGSWSTPHTFTFNTGDSNGKVNKKDSKGSKV
jgi:hypothetical protein